MAVAARGELMPEPPFDQQALPRMASPRCPQRLTLILLLPSVFRLPSKGPQRLLVSELRRRPASSLVPQRVELAQNSELTTTLRLRHQLVS